MKVNAVDLICGSVFILFGIFWGWTAASMKVGTALRMGPGYFPLVISCCIVAVGLIIVVKSFLEEAGPREAIVLPWRGMILLTAAPIVFGLLVRTAGLVPAVAATVVITFFASRRATLVSAIVLTIALTALCVAVFHYGLDVPVPLFA